MIEHIFITAFLMGLFGSTHCVAMCGGIVGVLSQHSPNQKPRFSVMLMYNTGRITTYCFIGAMVGLLGQSSFVLFEQETVFLMSKLLTSLFIFAFGFYLLGLPSFLPLLEKNGQRLWRYISPLTRRFLPIQSNQQAIMLGALWGLLPCGLVYSAVAMSLATTEPMLSVLTMLSFGLGTLPALFTVGFAAEKVSQLKQSNTAVRMAGLLVLMLGLWHLLSPSVLQHASHV